MLVMGGCSGSLTQPAQRSQKDRPLVITTFTVLADMAKNVAGELLEVQSITKTGAEVHGYNPTPSDLVKASRADLIVENGLGLELWADKFVAAAGDVPRVVLSEGIEPFLIADDVYAGKPNPHMWMSPKRVIQYVDRLVVEFSKAYPRGADSFARNGINYKKKLRKLDDELRSAMSNIPSEKRVLVTCEGAFTYLARDYDMDEAYLWPVNAESQVTPKRMLRLMRIIRERNIPTIFCESTVSSKAQLEVAESTGAKFGGIFYVDSLSKEDGPAPTLLRLMRHNVELILDGLVVSSD